MTNCWIWISLVIIFCQNKMHVCGKDGYCSWYGECGSSPTGKYNCEYTGPAIRLTNKTGLQILQTYCPDLVDGDSTLTCCDTDQLLTLKENMGLPQQFLLRCPSCYYNFLSLFCYQTCHRSMSNFIRVDHTQGYSKNRTSVTEISYFVSQDFANGMFDSCKEVQLPSIDDRALSIFCGHPAASCTIQKWLDYMGDPSNGNTPFKITYIITDRNYVDPTTNLTYNPMAAVATPCNESSYNKSACSCRDCQPDKCPPPKPVTIRCNSSSNSNNRLLYRTERLVITRPNNHTEVVHVLPGAYSNSVNYTSLFDKEFLHLLLDLQLEIESLKATYNNETITFDDVCLKTTVQNSSHCTTQSILEYWQKSKKNIDTVWYDETGFFIAGDYLDHFRFCARVPDSTKDYIYGSNMSCLATNSAPVYPWIVLGGYDEKYYMNATAFMITFVLNNHATNEANEKVEAWEQVLKDFIAEKQNYTANMTITFLEERSAIGVPFCNDNTTYKEFSCCVTTNGPVNCSQHCPEDVVYLSTSKLNCHDGEIVGVGIEPDTSSSNIGMNDTCPPGFKEISRNYSIPLCLQCNNTTPLESTSSLWTKQTNASITVSMETSTTFNTQSFRTETTGIREKTSEGLSHSTTHSQSVSVVSSHTTKKDEGKTSTKPTTTENSGGINKLTLAALVLSSIAVIGIVIILIPFIVRKKRRSADFDYMTLNSKSSSEQR